MHIHYRLFLVHEIFSYESKKVLRNQIFEIIENQIRENDPAETKETYDRLQKQGFDDLQTRQLIGQCLVVELFDVMKYGQPYNNERYIRNLKALPKEPFD